MKVESMSTLLALSLQVFHEQPNDWKLQIQYPTRERDEGLYECMVSSNPPILKRTWLSVVGE